MIQLRHKSASGSQLFTWALAIRNLCREYHALFIINDRVDIALASEADGVHLGQDDLPAAAARKLLGNTRIIGVSVSSPEEAVQAEKDGADYIGFGHVYPTVSKLKEHPPLGPENLQKTVQSISLPVVAIGGISIENAPILISRGASGVAVISAVSRAENPSKAAFELMRALQKSLL